MIQQVWFQNRRNIEKNVPRKRKMLFNLNGRIRILFYCVKHIHGQIRTYLKFRNIHFKVKQKLSRSFGKTLP
jgi:hypothetical protein